MGVGTTYADQPVSSMTSTTKPATIVSEGEGGSNAEAAAAEGSSGGQLVMPEDGYEWNKYGQKFIKNIQKIRSYFRCRHKMCSAKKKVEWHPRDHGNYVRVVYEGAHHHGSEQSADAGGQDAGGAPKPNQYELGAQVFSGARLQ